MLNNKKKKRNYNVFIQGKRLVNVNKRIKAKVTF